MFTENTARLSTSTSSLRCRCSGDGCTGWSAVFNLTVSPTDGGSLSAAKHERIIMEGYSCRRRVIQPQGDNSASACACTGLLTVHPSAVGVYCCDLRDVRSALRATGSLCGLLLLLLLAMFATTTSLFECCHERSKHGRNIDSTSVPAYTRLCGRIGESNFIVVVVDVVVCTKTNRLPAGTYRFLTFFETSTSRASKT